MKKNEVKTLYVVIPCYNEEEVLEETTRQLKEKMSNLIKDKKISEDSRVMYVNDGSKDKTWELIQKIHKEENLFTGICLSRNRGHQNALLAGLMTAKNYADVVISMDADLQDDINAMDEMIDYRLTSKNVLNHLENYHEVNLFLRGMFPLIGFKSDIVYYERNERFAGESKYPLKKMLSFAWDGITSFSIKPIKMVLNLGIVISIISVLVLIYSLIVKFLGNTVPGWTFIICSIWIVAGLEMLSLGIIGQYVGKIYNETKQRPRFIVAYNLNEKKEK